MPAGRPAFKKAAVRRATVEKMKELGTYKKEFEDLIDVYSGLIEQYYILLKRFEEGKYQIDIDCGFGESKKTNPIIRVLENLRKDIMSYSDRLMLNPKTYNAEIEQPKNEKSAFAKLLESQK